jgi:3-hydroxyacyl-[acyl-carrier-protein] dehydratase
VTATLLATSVTVVDHDEHGVTTELRVRADEPLFEGHYPRFPIFPGVALVEFGHASVLAAAELRRRQPRLAEVVAARFLGAVFPGDLLTGRFRIERDGDDWHCSGQIDSDRRAAATLRLRYTLGDSR